MLLPIVYQDKDFVIINKPAGLLAVPGLSHPDNCHDILLKKLPNCRVVHRLDMATSGLMIFALHYEAQKAMGKLFETRKISKTYTAIVDGHMTSHYGEIYSPMICDWEKRPKQKIDWLNGKMGITYFVCLKGKSANPKVNSTRIKLIPHTGRSHQLRLHMHNAGHSILGDQLYHQNNSHQKSTRLLLHATSLQFEQPMTKKNLNIECLAEF